jgi:hypothetical protein
VVRPAAGPKRVSRAPLTDGADMSAFGPGRPLRGAPDAAREPERGGLALLFGVESQPGCRTLREGDLTAATLVSWLFPSVPFQLGVPDGATTRTLALDEVAVLQGGAPDVRRCFGEKPEVRWDGRVPGFARASSSLESSVLPRHDWWFATIGPRDQAATSRDAAALTGPDTGNPERRLSIGVVHPAAISACFGPVIGEPRGANWVETLRWDVGFGADGNVSGAVSVRLAPPPR